MGQSGSGKSTLLHLLAALDRPDQGEIIVSGKPIHQLNERDATLFRRREIGIVFQQFNLIPTLSARENIELPGLLSADPPEKLRARSDELLRRLGLEGRAWFLAPTPSPAASSSVSRSPALCSSRPKSSSPTNPPATSTPPPAPSSGNS